MGQTIKSRTQYIDTHKIVDELAKDGRKVLYMNNALFPVLKVKVILREQNRDQMGDIEKAVLSLCLIGLKNIEELSFAMGMAAQRLAPLLMDISARGLINEVVEKDSTQVYYKMTELGRISLQCGKEVLDIEKVLLLCGVTGRLLPRNAYSLTLLDVNTIKSKVDLILESFELPLDALNMSKIKNKREVNLPDEALSVQGVIKDSSEPMFLEGLIIMHQKNNESVKVEIFFPGMSIDWLDEQKIIGMLEPLGYPELSPDLTLEKICCRLQELGAIVQGSGEINSFGNPCVEIIDADDRLLQTKYGAKSLGFYIGNNTYPPLPIGKLYYTKSINEKEVNVDLLKGRALTLKAKEGGALSKKISLLRLHHSLINQFYSAVYKGELPYATPLSVYLRKEFENRNVDVNKVLEVATICGDNRLLKSLQQMED